jgi:hypothetical protein
MAKRLVEQYPVATAVEIVLQEVWVTGEVVRHEHPGVWVRTGDGRFWFVTNGRRIRMKDES